MGMGGNGSLKGIPAHLYCDDTWLHGVVVRKMLVSINVVALHWARLLLGWVTVC